VRQDTLCIDETDIMRKITRRTRAIIPVDYAGYPAKICNTDIDIIQDAAHSVCGYAYGDMIVFSFHPVKNIATGDGGAVLTNDLREYKRMKLLAWCGIDRSTYARVKQKYGWEYDIQEVGYKYHWNDIQAALGVVQLERRQELLGRRRNIANMYHCGFANNQEITTPAEHPFHTWHLYVIRVDENIRDAVIDRLLENGISAGVHYKPLTHYKMYTNQRDNVPITEREWRRLISLPIYYDMTDDEVEFVIDKTNEAINA